MTYTRDETRPLADATVPCQQGDCIALAVVCRVWQTSVMRAPAFNYYCAEHAPAPKRKRHVRA